MSLLLIGFLLSHSFQVKAGTYKTYINNMRNAEINANGELVVTASRNSSAADFNFLLGDHHVHHKKLKVRLARSTD